VNARDVIGNSCNKGVSSSMTRMKIVISALLLLFTLSACTSDIESETHDSIFQVGVDELNNVKANEPFEIIG